MNVGNSVVGLWRDHDHVVIQDDQSGDAIIETSDYVDPGDYSDQKHYWGTTIAYISGGLLAAGWLGAIGYTRYLTFSISPITLNMVVEFIAAASAPLALILLCLALFIRSSKVGQKQYLQTVRGLRSEERRLDTILQSIASRLDDNRLALSEQSDTLSHIGLGASDRLKSTTEAIQAEIDMITRNMQALKNSAAAARADLAILLTNLPKAQVQTRQMVAALEQAGLTAHEKAGALHIQLTMLSARGREADEIAGNAAQKLAAHLSQMEGVSEVAGARLEQAAGQMTGAVDQALDRAAEALLTAREGMEAQGAAMLAMIEQNQAAMSKTGAESTDAIALRIAQIALQVDKIAQTFAAQDNVSATLMDRLNSDLETIETRFAAFDNSGIERTDRLSTAIGALRNHTDDLAGALQTGGDRSEERRVGKEC